MFIIGNGDSFLLRLDTFPLTSQESYEIIQFILVSLIRSRKGEGEKTFLKIIKFE